MKENINDYRKNGIINLDEYLSNNPEIPNYPYYLSGYDQNNFWTIVGKEDREKSVYVKPRNLDYIDNEYNAYSEMLYSELMNQVGIKTANIDIAMYNGYLATISENVNEDIPWDSFIISGDELMGQKYYDVTNNSSIEDLYDSIHEYCTMSYVPREKEEKCIEDIQKVCIADIFALSSSRVPQDLDFIAGMDKDGNECLELAPLCTNTYALCSNYTKDEMLDMLEDEEILNERINLCYSDTGVPEYKRNYNFPYWEDSLLYFVEESEENMEFAKKCAEKMNIDEAIKNVEMKMNTKIPSYYADFARLVFDTRTRQICSSLDLDYYKIMDNKYLEYEMEEI